MSDAALTALAEKAGLEPGWTDTYGVQHTVSPEILRAALRALGLAANSIKEIAESETHLSEKKRDLPPLITSWVGETFMAGGQTRKAPDSPGYYRIEADGQETVLAAAPQQCFGVGNVSEQRLAGVGAQVYALRGGHTAGFGDFAALADFVAQAAAHGIDAVATSPTHALFAAHPTRISPYSPSSRLFLNSLYADCGDGAHDDERDGLVDWPQASADKFSALKRAHERFLAAGATEEFAAFRTRGGERLFRHALFESLDSQFGQQGLWTWREWPPAYRDVSNDAVAEFARAHRDEIDYYTYLQFLAAKSAQAVQARAREAGMKIGIIADIATGIDPNGSDSWSAPDDVLAGLGIGAPPDPFNAAGQGWGLTALSPASLQHNGFAGFIALLRANMAYAGGVRIDHVMGLMRLWVIPDGASPTQGVYLRYPVEDLLRLTALESHRNRAVVIGEDLGTLPYGFRDQLTRRGVAGLQVLWFEREQGNFIPPARWRKEAIAITTTHDLPTIAGWWQGRDLDWWSKLGIGAGIEDPESRRRTRDNDRHALWSALREAHCVQGDSPPERSDAVVDGAIAYVASTPSRLAMVTAEDLLALVEQPNLPGTIDQHPNWRRRLPPGDFFTQPGIGDRLAHFIRARQGQ